MDFQKVLKQLQSSPTFTDWKKTHPEAFLAHAFLMLDPPNQNIWQIGYYDPSTKAMNTFVINSPDIDLIPEQDVLKSSEITKLDIEQIKIPEAQALEIAEKTRKQKYSQEQPAKTFFILQQHNNGPVYNITFFTASLKTLNIKLSALNGKIVSHSLQSLAVFS